MEDEKTDFEALVDLVTHMCEELVDDPSELRINHAYIGTTGCIEIRGPSDDIGKIMGQKKATIAAITSIATAVASKYRYRIFINVLNDQEYEEMCSYHDDVGEGSLVEVK